MKNNKIKLSVGLILGVFTLFGFLAVPTPASAITCNSVTITGDVITGTPPAYARFLYSPDYTTVANGGGMTTTVHNFYTEGTFPLDQFVSGLTENTTYYYSLVVTNDYGFEQGNINSFTTPACTTTPTPTRIDGGWSAWSAQDFSCGVSGTQTRTCTNPSPANGGSYCSGSSTQSYTNAACPVQSPTVTLYANPSSINSGQASTLTWNSSNATSCSSSWGGSNSTSGSSVIYPTYTTNYTITCYGNGQQASAAASVYVNQYHQQTCQDTTASNYGGILPCTYIQVCQDPSALNYRGVLPCSYQQIQVCQDVNALNYRGVLPCRYNVVVNNRPTVTLYADQNSVSYNGTATVRWLTTNATSCYANGGSVGWAGTKSIGPGSFYTGSLTSSKTYTITCNNNYGSATDSVTINVRSQVVTNNIVKSKPKTSLVLITSSVDRNQPIVPTIDNTRPRPGDEINYTVSYQNIGTGAITNLSLRINLPLEVDYLSSTPSAPTISGNTLVFNLGTLKANGQGTVTVKTRVRDNIPEGTNLNFPATLSYVDPSGFPQSVSANVSAQVWSNPENETVLPLGANAFWAGFLPNNIFGWLLLIIMILILAAVGRYLFDQSFRKKTTIVTDQPSGKKTTTTTVQ